MARGRFYGMHSRERRVFFCALGRVHVFLLCTLERARCSVVLANYVARANFSVVCSGACKIS